MFTVWTVHSQQEQQVTDPRSQIHNPSPFHSLTHVSATAYPLQSIVGHDAILSEAVP